MMIELLDDHPGIARLKLVTRNHLWWPQIDQEIEKVTPECQPCHKTSKAPPASPLHPWSWSRTMWQRIEVDFATYQSRHYLMVVDAQSKWPEVIGPMETTTVDSTIDAKRNYYFARYGLPTPFSQCQWPTLPIRRV